MKTKTAFDYATINEYGGRKQAGRVSVFVDLRSDTIIPVPRDVEHVDFVKRLAGEDDYGRIIPSHIDTKLGSSGQEEITGVITGVSGLEIALGVRHDKDDIVRAHSLVWDYINSGEVPVTDLKENKIVLKYSKK